MKRLLLLLLPLLLCGGCGTHDPGQYAIATALALDGGEDGWTLTAELANVGKDTAPTPSVLAARAVTPEAALERASLRAGRFIWSAQTGALVFGREAAERGVGKETLRLLERGPLEPNVFLAVVDGPGADALTAKPALGQLCGTALAEGLTRAAGRSAVPNVSLCGFCALVAEPGIEAVLPLLSVPASGPAAPAGTALFVGGRLVGTLDAEETRWLLLLSGSAEQATLSVCGAPLLLERAKRRVLVTDETLSVELTLTLSNAEEQTLCAAAERDVRRGCEDVLRTLQALRCDAAGFGATLRRRSPQLWQTCADDWPRTFSALTTAVEVHIAQTVRRSGDG